MRLVFFGSGAFGLPTIERLVDVHDVALVVTQPDRPAGRHRRRTPTPIGSFAETRGIATFKPEGIDERDELGRAAVDTIRGVDADAYVVIAYGHKLGRVFLDGVFAINLHASLLPRYRGAAPIQRAVMNGERETGVSVITLAARMDAGDVLATAATTIDPAENAGELHDRLAPLGAPLVLETLERYAKGALEAVAQDETLVCPAPKLSRADGTVDFEQPADRVRARIHGLNPWPGCAVVLGGTRLTLRRAAVVADCGDGGDLAPGTLRDDLTIQCRPGAIRLLTVQPAGGREMAFEDYCRGRSVAAGGRVSAP